ncbi:MAG: Rrf2 family transcriptional regulator [Acidobacteriota bacterium]|nr:Rrf2 family transcriptional regulator [Acidobacteriota bacterium]
MALSTRFTVALHVLTLLAAYPGQALASAYIAGSVNTNAAFVRRLMGSLRRAGLVHSQPGTGGGWQLARPAEEITLRSVRHALGEGPVFAMHSQRPNPKCTVGRHIQGALTAVYGEAEKAMEMQLEQHTVASLLRSVRGRR